MGNVLIDESKCTGCGLCASDCVGFDISIENNKAVAHGESCIKCGHCEAICPKHAVTLEGYNDTVEEFSKQVRLDPKTLLDAIKTRRTIRQFTDKQVPQEIIDLIIEAGRLSPTGTNAQGTSYIILNQKKDDCEKAAVKIFRKGLGIGKKILPMLRSMTVSDSYFFKKAPVVIVVLGKDKVSASLAAENMALMAEANGLGVLFSGFFTMCLSFSKKIQKIIGLKKKEYPVTTLVIGYPAVKYHRTAHRNPANVIQA